MVNKVTWKQAKARGWLARAGTFVWITDDGRKHTMTDRLARVRRYVLSRYVAAGVLNKIVEEHVYFHIGEKKYEIINQPMATCSRCGQETWDLDIVFGRCPDCRRGSRNRP